MQFQYVAYTTDKRVVRGSIDANSQSGAEQALQERGWRPLNLTCKRTGIDITKIFPSLFSVKAKDVADFSRQLALLLECGVTISMALQLLQENVTSRAMRNVISELNSDLRNGISFSKAISKHPEVFNDLYARIVALGERTGSMETSLREIVAYFEKQQASKKKVTKALTYPIIVLVMAFGVAILMTTVVLPQMTGLFTSMKVELPLPTKILIGLSAFVSANQSQLMAGLIGVLLILGGLVARPSGRAMLQKLVLRTPLVGKLIAMIELARFSRTTAMLLHAGINLTDVMDMACNSTRNIVVGQAIKTVRSDLIRGRTLAVAMGTHKVFTAALVQMVAVGEETGRLESTLATIAQAYETEADEKTTALISFIEPAMTLVIALVVGFIALSVVMPMYTIIGTMG